MKKTLLALMLAGVATSASADSWLYAGANFGQASIGEADSTTTYGFHVGTGILPIIGLEAGYVNHGGPEYSELGQNVTIETSSVYAAIKPSIDFGPLHVYGKLGMHAYANTASGGGYTLPASEEGSYDIMYGVGAEYFLIDLLSVGAGYQSYSVEKGSIESFTINATIHFL